MDLLTLILPLVTFKFAACSPTFEVITNVKPLKIEDLWSQLEIKSRPFLTMPYGDFRVPIYEHRHNDPKADGHLFYLNRYFYAPVPLLDHSSTTVTKNDETNQAEVKFRVEMWSSRLEREVALYLKDVIGKEIKLQQLQIVPFERLLLTGQSTFTKFWKKYELEKNVWFSLPCRGACQKFKADPKLVAKDLMLKFTIDSALSLRGQLSVNIDEIINSVPTYRRIRDYFNHENVIYATGEIFEQLIDETVEYIERDMLGRQKVLMTGSLVRKKLHGMLSSSGKVSYAEINQDLIYPPKKETKEVDAEDYKDFDELLVDEEPQKNTSYYEMNLGRLESYHEPQDLNHVYALAMMSTTVRENSILYKEDHAYNQKVTIHLFLSSS